MPRHAIDRAAATDLGRKATTLRKRYEKVHGRAGDGLLSAEVYKVEGYYIDKETMRKIHAGLTDPNTVAIETLGALARFYGVSHYGLGKVAGERVERVRGLLTSPSP